MHSYTTTPLTVAILTLCAFCGTSSAAEGAAESASKAANATTVAAASAATAAGSDASPAKGAGDSLVAGIGLAVMPEYAGSDKNRALPVPIIDRQFANGFYLSTMRGAGYQTSVDGVGLSAALAYGGARPDHKENAFYGSDAFRGMGRISGAAQLVLGASYDVGGVILTASTKQNLTRREHGNTYTLGAAMSLYRSTTDQVGLGAEAQYDDAKHAQTYFGVSGAQSISSGYGAYQARAGFEHVSASVNWNHVLDKSWSVNSALAVSRLTNDAAGSPLTERKVAPTVMTSLLYKFW